jgi:hypothetical protein
MAFDDLMRHRVSIYAMYYKIAYERVVLYQERDNELRTLETRRVAEEEINEIAARTEECYQEREQCAVVAVTFAGMALEAFFYNYAAESLGDNFVQEHLDRLDLRSKFLVYPYLVCGKSPDKSKAAYHNLGQLAKLRNDLVHFKSKSFPITDLDKASDFHDNLNERLRRGVLESTKCVMLVMSELDTLHGGSAFTITMRSAIATV